MKSEQLKIILSTIAERLHQQGVYLDSTRMGQLTLGNEAEHKALLNQIDELNDND